MAGAGDTVTVACKLPNGFFMTTHKLEKYSVPVLGGGVREETRALPTTKPIRIRGPAAPEGMSPRAPVAGGYALTHNVPADVAQRWFEENKASDMVVNKVVYISKTRDAAVGQAKEQVDQTSGFERLNPEKVVQAGREVAKDPRWPRTANPNLTSPTTDTRED